MVIWSVGIKDNIFRISSCVKADMFIPMKPLIINKITKNLQNVVENVSEKKK